MRNKKGLQLLILAAILVVGVVTLAGNLFNTEKPPTIGDQAPDFALPTLEGGTGQLSDYRDRLIVLNFWGTYCPPCVSEMPLLQDYYEQYKDRGVTVIGVNENDPLVTAKGFVRQYGITFPIWMDKDTVRKQYGVTDYPTTFFIKDGVIRHIAYGEMNEPYLANVLTSLLGG